MKENNKKNFFVYFLFMLSAFLIVGIFVTSTTYTQLAIATLLYPPLMYFAFKTFPSKPAGADSKKITIAVQPVNPENEPDQPRENDAKESKGVEIVDFDKRAFLKLIGAAGFSFFLFSLLSRKIEDLIFSRDSSKTGASPLADSATSQTTEGYKISEIDSSEFTYYGFVNNNGGWYIMKEDPTVGSFRYIKGEEKFPTSWSNRQHLKYDYFHNVFN